MRVVEPRYATRRARHTALTAPAESTGPLTVNGTGRDGQPVKLTVDALAAAPGFRPDLDMLREVRLDLDPTVEAPARLAPLIDPNFHSCGTVPPHGRRLAHPDDGFYIVGMKSYGRAPTALLRTGYEQVRSVVAGLSGDWESARRVELVLPETGVCSLIPPANGADPVAVETHQALAGEAVPPALACCG